MNVGGCCERIPLTQRRSGTCIQWLCTERRKSMLSSVSWFSSPKVLIHWTHRKVLAQATKGRTCTQRAAKATSVFFFQAKVLFPTHRKKKGAARKEKEENIATLLTIAFNSKTNLQCWNPDRLNRVVHSAVSFLSTLVRAYTCEHVEICSHMNCYCASLCHECRPWLTWALTTRTKKWSRWHFLTKILKTYA